VIHDFDESFADREMQPAVQESRFLNTLPSEQVARLVRKGAPVHFPADATILDPSAQGDEAYIIQQGIVSVGLYQDEGSSLWLYVSGPGSIVDLYAALDPPIVPVTARALTDVEALAVRGEVRSGGTVEVEGEVAGEQVPRYDVGEAEPLAV
jgi:hypothetical protein